MRTLLLYCLCALPLRKLHVTSPFGKPTHPIDGKYAFHNGVDLRARLDTVYAVVSGMVRVSKDPALGLSLRIADGKLLATYGHLHQVLALPGTCIQAGEPVAISGASGRVTAPHLHFAMSCGRQYFDPLPFLFILLIPTNHE